MKGVTARRGVGVGGGGISLYAPRRSSQHLVGDAFQLDGEQLNPSTAGQREEEGIGKLKKKEDKKPSNNESTSQDFR